MHNKINILVFGDSNSWGWVAGKNGSQRYSYSERWPGVMALNLGANYNVIEESLGGRTTNTSDPRPTFPHRNGHSLLPIILETHAPLNLVIIMLGTADLKPLYDISAKQIADGLELLVNDVKNAKYVNNSKPPKCLILAPTIIDDSTNFAKDLFAGGTNKSKQLVTLYKDIAKNNDCLFFNSNPYCKVDPTEGIHITKESHQNLGNALAQFIKTIFR